MKKYLLVLIIAILSFNLLFAEDVKIINVLADGVLSVAADDVTNVYQAVESLKDIENIKHVKINLLEGSHYLPETIILDNEVLKNNIGLEIAGVGNARVFGGVASKLEGLQEEAKGVYSFSYSGELQGLFIDGEKYRLARYPNYNPKITPYNGYASYRSLLRRAKSKKWDITEDVFFHALHGGRWGGYHYRIISYSSRNFKLKGGHQNNRPEHPFSREFSFVEGVFQELDRPGEYYYDKASSRVYFMPLENAKIDQDSLAEIVTSKSLFQILGEDNNPLKNILFENIKFQGCGPTFMDEMEPLLRSDWMVARNAALFIENAKDIKINSCSLEDLDGNAVFVSRYGENIEVSSSVIARIGGSGVSFVGDPKDVRDPLFNYHGRHKRAPSSEKGPLGNNHPVDCLVYDNIICDIGLIEKQVAGVQISMASGIHVKNNSIYNLPRSGINISEGTWGGHILEGNDVFATVLETSDHGAFNSWGRDRFWDLDRTVTDKWVAADKELALADVVDTIIIRNNRFECYHGWDIDLDDGSSNYKIYNNLCLAGGIKLREGFNREVTNNIMVDNTFHPHVWYKEDDSDIFKYNIVFRAYEPIRLDGEGAEIDYNFFHKTRIAGQAYDSWDRNSVSGNANFVNEKKGDYRLREDSPALELGFKNFDLENFGVVSEDLKEIALKPDLFKTEIVERKHEFSLISWKGLELKTVETLGEQSAAGLSRRAGVLVLGGDKEVLNKLGLETDDVIISLGKVLTDDVEIFQQAVKRYRNSRSLELIFSRNQTIKTNKINLKEL